MHHSYSKELTMSWSRSVWLFCLDITYGQSLRDTYSIMSLSDWTMCTWSDICVHGLNMTRCIEQYKSQLQADHGLASYDRFIRHRSLAPTLTAMCPLFPCMSVGHAWWQCWCACDPTIQKMKFIQELSFIYTRQYYLEVRHYFLKIILIEQWWCHYKRQ